MKRKGQLGDVGIDGRIMLKLN